MASRPRSSLMSLAMDRHGTEGVGMAVGGSGLA